MLVELHPELRRRRRSFQQQSSSDPPSNLFLMKRLIQAQPDPIGETDFIPAFAEAARRNVVMP
jgi:hypothetical protein